MQARAWAWLVVLLLLVHPAGAQVPAPQTPPAPAAEPADPLGRETPRGTIAGFTAAVHDEDFVAAGAFMEGRNRTPADVESLARTLAALMDRFFTSPFATLSALPGGIPDDGLPPDQDRIVLTLPTGPADVVLRRTRDRQGGNIWLISSQTLARVPALGRALKTSWTDRFVPDWLADRSLFGIPLAGLVMWTASVAIPLVVLWLAFKLFIFVAQRTIRVPARREMVESWARGLRTVVILLLAIGAHLAVLRFLGFSLRFRVLDTRVSLIVAVVLFASLAWSILGLSFRGARHVAQRRGRASAQSLMLLAERLSKVLVILLAIFALLRVAGVEMTTALAGVGLGGVALALGAQKSVENLIGAVSLLTDKAIAVGDTCSIGGRVGQIEDISLRSVRLRTVEQTLVSIPAGVLSQSNIENFSTRQRIPAQTILRLRYGTTAVQLHSIIDQIHDLLLREPLVDAASARVQLMNFGPQAIEIELFAYVKTTDGARFNAVRQELLLAAAAIVESAGSGFARPTDFLYVTSGAGEAHSTS